MMSLDAVEWSMLLYPVPKYMCTNKLAVQRVQQHENKDSETATSLNVQVGYLDVLAS